MDHRVNVISSGSVQHEGRLELKTWQGAVFVLLLVMALPASACSLWPPGREAVTPTPSANNGTLKYEIVTIAQTGLSFYVPGGWQRLQPAWAWSPDSTGQPRVAVQWKDVQPPMEMEAAMLPQSAVTLDAEPVELSWGQGRRYTVEVYAPAAPSSGKETTPQVEAVEIHVLIAVETDGGTRVFDFYASARDAGELATVQPALEQMWTLAELAS